MKEIHTLNIPVLSVTQAVQKLSDLYIRALERGFPLKKLPAVFLWGPAGIGKSEGIRQLADTLGQKTGKRVGVRDVRLLLFSPIDLRGVPVADEKKEFTLWLKPRIFDMETGSDVVNILFLDELSAAPQSVQAAAYQICLDRKIGEHTLPDNCIVIAAGNRTTDQSVAYQMPKALCNRLMHFEIRADYESWRAWALVHGISRQVIGYLAFDPSRLSAEPSPSDLAYPTPRSWQYVSDLLTILDCRPRDIHQQISACVGTDTAAAFEAWCEQCRDLPSVEDIFQGTCTVYPRTNDALFALSSGLSEALVRKGSGITQQELDNVCRYAKTWPIEFAMKFFQDIRSMDFLSGKLLKCRSMQEWLTRNKKLFREG